MKSVQSFTKFILSSNSFWDLAIIAGITLVFIGFPSWLFYLFFGDALLCRKREPPARRRRFFLFFQKGKTLPSSPKHWRRYLFSTFQPNSCRKGLPLLSL